MSDRPALLLWAMSNLGPMSTGVEGVVIWVSAREFASAGHPDVRNGPRILVVLGESLSLAGLTGAVSVRLTDPPEVVGILPEDVHPQVVLFVARNRNVLLSYWSCEISTSEMLDQLRRP